MALPIQSYPECDYPVSVEDADVSRLTSAHHRAPPGAEQYEPPVVRPGSFLALNANEKVLLPKLPNANGLSSARAPAQNMLNSSVGENHRRAAHLRPMRALRGSGRELADELGQKLESIHTDADSEMMLLDVIHRGIYTAGSRYSLSVNDISLSIVEMQWSDTRALTPAVT